MLSGFIIKIGANVIRLRASYLKKGLMNLVSLAKEVADKKKKKLIDYSSTLQSALKSSIFYHMFVSRFPSCD